MSVISFEIFAIIILFLMAFIAGLLPSSIMKRHQNALALGDAWAGGIFLGAALFHMLPDANKILSSAFPGSDYPFASLFCILGFLLLLMTERTVIQLTDSNHKNNSYITGILLLIILSIHSIIEGTAIGINVTLAAIIPITIAVLAHKGSASFALAMNLHRSQLQTKTITFMIFIFSLMTPLGIILSNIILIFSKQHSSLIMEGIFNAFAAGSFLYIGMRHMLEEHFAEYKHTNPLKEFIAIISGIFLMAVIAIWT